MYKKASHTLSVYIPVAKLKQKLLSLIYSRRKVCLLVRVSPTPSSIRWKQLSEVNNSLPGRLLALSLGFLPRLINRYESERKIICYPQRSFPLGFPPLHSFCASH